MFIFQLVGTTLMNSQGVQKKGRKQTTFELAGVGEKEVR